MIDNFVERIFWIQDQTKLKAWQEDRLHHSIALDKFHNGISLLFDKLVRAYMSKEKLITISNELFVIENDVDMNMVIHEAREFLDYIKSDKEGWGGAMQSLIDEILSVVEIFANTYNKQ